MNTSEISASLLELIAGRKVLAAIFTTYTFEADFFELEVIPLLLDQDMPYSSDDRVKHFLVRENLRESGIPIDVFYDLPMVRQSSDQSPDMEYLFHGVNLGNCAFHGKINLILVEDEKSGDQSLLLAAGSNNLTRAGWWDNVECQHWVEIAHKTMSQSFKNQLIYEIGYLQDIQSFSFSNRSSAVDLIEYFIVNCKSTYSSIFKEKYFGLHNSGAQESFIDFLKSKKSPLKQFNNWTLEIISPFFADDPDNTQHDHFFSMGVNEIKLLLPFDDVGQALCQPDYFENINQEENIHWAQWQEGLSRSLGADGDVFRRLHAKIYHFYNKKQSWMFVGSVNFTYKAMNENVEAGFLAPVKRDQPLLDIITDINVDQFANLDDELLPGSSEDEKNIVLPELHLCYDWVGKRLSGFTSRGKIHEIEIINTENKPVILPWEIKTKKSVYDGDTEELEKLLKNGSLVRVRGISKTKKIDSSFIEHHIMLQQIGWSHKPQNLPDLTAEQILAIYAGMDPEKRKMLLVNAKVRALILSAQAGELSSEDDDKTVEQFFSEYAELFNAFRKLRKKLDYALDEQNYMELDYYLTGSGVDSLKTLVNMAQDDESEHKLKAVSRYLILLSALEIYALDEFSTRPNIDEELEDLIQALDAFRQSDAIKLEDNTQKNRGRFFRWFEEEFLRVYRVIGSDQ